MTSDLVDNGRYGTIWHNLEYTGDQISGQTGSLSSGQNILYFTPPFSADGRPRAGVYGFRYTIRAYARVGGVSYDIHTSSATATLTVTATASDSSPPVSRELPPPPEGRGRAVAHGGLGPPEYADGARGQSLQLPHRVQRAYQHQLPHHPGSLVERDRWQGDGHWPR